MLSVATPADSVFAVRVKVAHPEPVPVGVVTTSPCPLLVAVHGVVLAPVPVKVTATESVATAPGSSARDRPVGATARVSEVIPVARSLYIAVLPLLVTVIVAVLWPSLFAVRVKTA
jgi:hypothetical protein